MTLLPKINNNNNIFLNILKREDVKKELTQIFCPIIDFIFSTIKPYIYLFIFLFILIFLLLLSILILLLGIIY